MCFTVSFAQFSITIFLTKHLGGCSSYLLFTQQQEIFCLGKKDQNQTPYSGVLMWLIFRKLNSAPLCQKCANLEFFLVRIFLHSIQIQENKDQKKLCIWTLFTHIYLISAVYVGKPEKVFSLLIKAISNILIYIPPRFFGPLEDDFFLSSKQLSDQCIKCQKA